jgi:hypothetical protein
MLLGPFLTLAVTTGGKARHATTSCLTDTKGMMAAATLSKNRIPMEKNAHLGQSMVTQFAHEPVVGG